MLEGRTLFSPHSSLLQHPVLTRILVYLDNLQYANRYIVLTELLLTCQDPLYTDLEYPDLLYCHWLHAESLDVGIMVDIVQEIILRVNIVIGLEMKLLRDRKREEAGAGVNIGDLIGKL